MKAESKTAGGIFLPESSVKELNEAKVLAVGPGAWDKSGNRMAMSVKEGDKVLIPQVKKLKSDPMQYADEMIVRWQSCEGWRGRVSLVQRSRVRTGKEISDDNHTDQLAGFLRRSTSNGIASSRPMRNSIDLYTMYHQTLQQTMVSTASTAVTVKIGNFQHKRSMAWICST